MAFGGFDAQAGGRAQAEINMVPLIDVMLVLLIIFMITAPLLSHGVRIDLPHARSTPAVADAQTVVLALDAEGRLFWNDEPVAAQALEARLAELAARDPQAELHLRADRETRYQILAETLAAAQRAGIERIGFITRPGELAAP